MKKLLLLLIVSASVSFAQITPLMRTYTVTTSVSGGMNIRSLYLNRCLYNVYWEPQGICIQKNDVNGVPVLKKMLNAIAPTPQNRIFVDTRGNNIYISGTRTTAQGTVTSQMPFVAAVDTASCGLVFYRDYTVTAGFNTANIWESKILANGNLMLAGNVTNTGGGPSNPAYGVFMGVNGTNGNVVYTTTLAIAGSTANTVLSFAEISNSSIIYSAYGGASSYIGKCIKTASTLTASSVFLINGGIGSVESYNSKKFLIHSPLFIYKADTSLNINSTGLLLFSANASVYKSGKVYRMIGGNSRLEIVDTSLTVNSTMSYSTALSGLPCNFAQCLSKDSSNLYINLADTLTSKTFYLLKTGLQGQMNCAAQMAPNSSTIQVVGTQMNVFSTSVTAQSLSLTPIVTTLTVAHAPSCTNVGLKENRNGTAYRLVMSDGVYYLQTESNLTKLEIYDLTGKIIRKENCSGTNVAVDLREFQRGIYIGKATDSNKTEFTFKLIN